MTNKREADKGRKRRREDASRKAAYEPKKPIKLPKVKPPDPPPSDKGSNSSE